MIKENRCQGEVVGGKKAPKFPLGKGKLSGGRPPVGLIDCKNSKKIFLVFKLFLYLM